jgi:hypothetical protein
MSHHLDSPLARQDPRLDITDLYVFRGQHGTVLITNHSHSLADSSLLRGLHPEGRYEFKVDLNGDAVEELTYRFVFSPCDNRGRQTFCLSRLSGSEAAEPTADGVVIGRGITGEPADVIGGGRAWVGKAGDPFWIEPTVLRAVGKAFHDGAAIDLAEGTVAAPTNAFAGQTVYSIVLELSDDELLAAAGAGSRPVGVWALASLATDAGGWRPINRAGLPMIHPLFTQLDEELADQLNTNVPADDRRLHADRIATMVAGVIRANGTALDPDAYAWRVVEQILPNILPYAIGSPASYGFAGWNGRSLIDNAPDVMFSFAANTPVALGIGRDSVAAKPSPMFPYVPTLPRQ